MGEQEYIPTQAEETAKQEGGVGVRRKQRSLIKGRVEGGAGGVH